MRRIVATLLVVSSPVLMVVPAGAGDPVAVPTVVPAAVPTVVPAAPAPIPTVIPTAPETLAPPALPAPASAKATAVVRPVGKTARAKAPTAAAADDAAYTARLQADLCQARAIFCGLDRNGRYPAG